MGIADIVFKELAGKLATEKKPAAVPTIPELPVSGAPGINVADR